MRGLLGSGVAGASCPGECRLNPSLRSDPIRRRRRKAFRLHLAGRRAQATSIPSYGRPRPLRAKSANFSDAPGRTFTLFPATVCPGLLQEIPQVLAAAASSYRKEGAKATWHP